MIKVNPRRISLRAFCAALALALGACGFLNQNDCPAPSAAPPGILKAYLGGYGTDLLTQRSLAVDINDKGRIVGFVDEDSRSGRKPYGFAMNADQSGLIQLATPDHPFIPVALNDSGLVAGYAPQGDLASIQDAFAAGQRFGAALIRDDGTGFIDLNPKKFWFSRASAVSPSGLAAGSYSPDSAGPLHACLFNYHDTLVDLHVPGAVSSEAVGVNDSLVAVNAWFTGASGGNRAYLVHLGDPWTRVAVDSAAGDLVLTALRDTSLVGYRILNGTLHGFFYATGSLVAREILAPANTLGGPFFNPLPFAVSRNGWVVGQTDRAYRGYAQSRAFAWNAGTGAFKDITLTPDVYGLAQGVNDSGVAVGYGGFRVEDCGVKDLAVLMTAN